ncbi:hydrogenase nickel incorporation protein HypB [Parasalinivibrio latis]|uniref:hydrogenase nickel incorporation protein HypB n=1 Tax=Parasalinivibrio latis TaxID=2952610 RepID=UPI0030E2CD55
MCTVCGCGEGQVKIEGHHGHEMNGHHGHDHSDHDPNEQGHHHHHHAGEDTVETEGTHHYGKGAAGAHAPGLSQARMVQIEQDILGKNDRYAAANRARFSQSAQLVLNLVSSPGSGKTTLLTETLTYLKETMPVAVIEGDQQTANDAERIRATGVKAVQVNTGKGCHLDAHMVGHALDSLALPDYGILFIENVGNLVCPAAFDLGEAHKVAILSVTEGEDKPIKYPDMFAAADLVLLNKIDLLPHLSFDLGRCRDYLKAVNPNAEILEVSATSGEGMDEWFAWLSDNRRALLEARRDKLQTQLDAIAIQLEAAG